MKRRRHTPEQIIRKLREAERMLAEGSDVAEVAKALDDAHDPGAGRAPRPPAGAARRAGRAVDADRRPGARERGTVRARAGPPSGERALRQAQHQAADAAAGHPRLPRVRLRLLPHLDAHDQQADLLLPLHRLGQLPPHRRARLPQPSDPRRRARRARLERGTVPAREPHARARRDRPPAAGAAHRTPRRAPSRGHRTRPGPRRRRDRPPDRGLPRAADLARGATRPHARPAQARDRAARPTRRARCRAAQRRNLPQARRYPRKLPRPPRRRPPPAHRRGTPAGPAPRRPRSANRRRGRRDHGPTLAADPIRRWP